MSVINESKYTELCDKDSLSTYLHGKNMPYEYRTLINRVIDGDTVEVDVDLGFGIWMKDQTIRLVGIDAPETRTLNKEEKLHGMRSKQRLFDMLPVGTEIILRSVKASRSDAKDKYGRILGDFIIGERSACAILLEEGLAEIYS
jgi:micrococcal nuclease